MIARLAAALGLLALLGSSGALGAQSAEVLAGQCEAGGGDAALCARGAAAARDLAVYVGVLAAPGSELSGQASTLGRRLGGMPRLAVSARAGAVRVTLPGLAGAGAADESSFVPAAQATAALGLFDGFGVLPTVGGVLSVDLIGTGSFLLFPEEDGFDGRADVYSVGVRVGLLRESFTLPAVTLSASRRLGSALRLGDVGAGDLAEASIDPSITSLRAVVGKDLFAFGVLAGVGWDEISSEATLRASDGAGVVTSRAATLEGSRWTAFGGVSKQIGVLAWLSGEVGWTAAFAPVNSGGGASPDAGNIVYGSAALVLKL